MIAICMPCWNNLGYTGRAVHSIISHSLQHQISFFFVDNGSTDGTLQYLQTVPYMGQITANVKNEGVSKAWNQLLFMALNSPCEYICLINNDILAGPNWLDPVVTELSKCDKRYFLANGNFPAPTTGKFEEEVIKQLPDLKGKTEPGKAGWCLFFRKATVLEFFPIPEYLVLWYGDNFIHSKLAKAGYKCEVLMDSAVYHYQSKSVLEYPNYVQQVEYDRQIYNRITGESL